MSALRVLVNDPIKESFYEKKKVINILTVFFIFYKNNVKTFLKWIVNQCPKNTLCFIHFCRLNLVNNITYKNIHFQRKFIKNNFHITYIFPIIRHPTTF